MTVRVGRAELNKSEKIKLLLSKSSLTHSEIADVVDTSERYVDLIDYDVRSNGGAKRAYWRYRQSNPRTRTGTRVPGAGNSESFNAAKRNWVSQYPEEAREVQERYYAKSDGIASPSSRRRWTFREDEIILTVSGTVPDIELARRISRSLRSIQTHRSMLRKSHIGVIDVRTTIPGRTS